MKNVKNKKEITNAEWSVMRIVWTLDKVKGSRIINLMLKKKNWKKSTVETLLHRLLKKDMLNVIRSGRSFIYFPNIKEQDAIDLAVSNLFDNICSMHAGETLLNLLSNLVLSKDDIKKLSVKLNKKISSAPNKVKCNCLNKKECF